MYPIEAVYMDNNCLRNLVKTLYEKAPSKVTNALPNILGDLDGVCVRRHARFRDLDWYRCCTKVAVVPDFAYAEVLVASYRLMIENKFHLKAGIVEDDKKCFQ